MSALCTICTANAVSTTSLLVRPKWNQRLARSLIFSATAVVKPMTSWLSVFSSSFWRATRPGRSANHWSAPRFHLGKIASRHDAFRDERLAGEQFDLQPDAELVFVGPDGPHFRAGIARNHEASVRGQKSGVEPLSLCFSAPRSRESRVECQRKALDPRPSTLDCFTPVLPAGWRHT